MHTTTILAAVSSAEAQRELVRSTQLNSSPLTLITLADQVRHPKLKKEGTSSDTESFQRTMISMLLQKDTRPLGPRVQLKFYLLLGQFDHGLITLIVNSDDRISEVRVRVSVL